VYDFIVEVPHNMVSLNIYQHVLLHNVFYISVYNRSVLKPLYLLSMCNY